jgi:hypothetical protein
MRTDGLQRRNLASEVRNLDGYRQLLAERSGREVVPNPTEPGRELAEQLRALGYTE